MRVLLVGTATVRARLRAALANRQIEIAAEFSSLAAAHASRVQADAVISAIADEEPAVDETLTPREREVLELLAEGLSNKGIGARLGISDQTVKFHVASIAGKLGAANRTDAVRLAVRRGLLTI
jgi:DNA-binding NarL/FixJ family response regulator